MRSMVYVSQEVLGKHLVLITYYSKDQPEQEQPLWIGVSIGE